MRYYFKKLCCFIINLLAGRPGGLHELPRQWILQIIGVRIAGPGQISENLFVYDGRNLELGTGVRLGAFSRIWDFSKIRLGDNLLASHNLTLIAGTHQIEDFSHVSGPITIGANVWIGANVTIVGPVDIGDNAVIGACSFVKGPIPAGAVCGGSPARILKMRADAAAGTHPGHA